MDWGRERAFLENGPSLPQTCQRGLRLWRTVEHDYDFRSVRLHFFHITEFSGEPVANDGQAFRWVTPEEALTLPFLEADRPLLFDLSRP